jgi:hypothetical protein
MKKHIVERFKEVTGKKINLRRLTTICGGDSVMARRVVVRGLRELAKEGITNPLQSKVYYI